MYNTKVKPLSQNEMKETNGGIILYVAAGYYLYKNWDDVKAGWNDYFMN